MSIKYILNYNLCTKYFPLILVWCLVLDYVRILITFSFTVKMNKKLGIQIKYFLVIIFFFNKIIYVLIYVCFIINFLVMILR